MTDSSNPIRYRNVLVSDFDGTMTQHDFYKLALEQLIPPTVPDYWSQYRDGIKTHFEALQAYFAEIQGSEEDVLRIVGQMELDPQLESEVERLKNHGWKVVVTSAGCDWYIRRLLGSIDIEICANPGRFVSGQGLQMELPIGKAYFSPTLGVDKAGVVRRLLEQGFTVAFAGDGFPDLDPARLVSDDLRFARRDLAGELMRENLPFHSFQTWSEIAERLTFSGKRG